MLASGVIHQAYCQPNNQAKAVTPHHATDSRGPVNPNPADPEPSP